MFTSQKQGLNSIKSKNSESVYPQDQTNAMKVKSFIFMN